MYTELSRRIRSLREQYGFNQKYAAEKLCISPQAYSHYENGRRTPDIEMLHKLSKLYHVSMEFLLTGDSSADLPIPENSIVFRDTRDLTREEIEEFEISIDYLRFGNYRHKC